MIFGRNKPPGARLVSVSFRDLTSNSPPNAEHAYAYVWPGKVTVRLTIEHGPTISLPLELTTENGEDDALREILRAALTALSS